MYEHQASSENSNECMSARLRLKMRTEKESYLQFLYYVAINEMKIIRLDGWNLRCIKLLLVFHTPEQSPRKGVKVLDLKTDSQRISNHSKRTIPPDDSGTDRRSIHAADLSLALGVSAEKCQKCRGVWPFDTPGFVLHRRGGFALMSTYGTAFTRAWFFKGSYARITWLANGTNRGKFVMKF